MKTHNYKIINDIENKEWDYIVKSFENYSVHYLSNYLKTFMKIENSKPEMFFYDDGKNRGVNVYFVRDISMIKEFEQIERNKYFDLITPYGYGGFLVDGDANLIQKEYDNYCKMNNYICEFIRFNLAEHFENKYNGSIETRTHNVIKKIDVSKEDIFKTFKHNVRKNINTANKNELYVRVYENGSVELDDFTKIYYSTMKRNNANESFYFDNKFFETLNKSTENVAYFFTYDKNNIAISTELVIYDENYAYSYLGGTLSEYFPLRPNEILKYEIIKWCYDKNLKGFVLGGGYGADDGIFNYKCGFAPDGIVNFYIGRKIFNEEVYNKLCEIKNVSKDEGFFPAYRKNIL